MHSLKDTTKFNEEPVMYCSHCLSLKILGIPSVEGLEYCDECGSTEVKTCNIHEWEEMYEKRYGTKFLNKKY